MYLVQANMSSTVSWFGAKTIVASVVIALALLALVAEAQDGCKTECYPDKKVFGKGGNGKGEHCRWILRPDGKAARLCDHIKCRKVCPGDQSAMVQDHQGDASDNMRIEQRTERDSGLQQGANPNMGLGGGAMGIMRQLHGSKLSKAPVPGVPGGRLVSPPSTSAPSTSFGRRTAPTLAPEDADTPPPIGRFLDVSPETAE